MQMTNMILASCKFHCHYCKLIDKQTQNGIAQSRIKHLKSCLKIRNIKAVFPRSHDRCGIIGLHTDAYLLMFKCNYICFDISF